jgi:biotin transporter BioY
VGWVVCVWVCGVWWRAGSEWWGAVLMDVIVGDGWWCVCGVVGMMLGDKSANNFWTYSSRVSRVGCKFANKPG